MCIVCGKSPAKLDRNRGYYLMLCADHAAVRKNNRNALEDFWDVTLIGQITL